MSCEFHADFIYRLHGKLDARGSLVTVSCLTERAKPYPNDLLTVKLVRETVDFDPDLPFQFLDADFSRMIYQIHFLRHDCGDGYKHDAYIDINLLGGKMCGWVSFGRIYKTSVLESEDRWLLWIAPIISWKGKESPDPQRYQVLALANRHEGDVDGEPSPSVLTGDEWADRETENKASVGPKCPVLNDFKTIC